MMETWLQPFLLPQNGKHGYNFFWRGKSTAVLSIVSKVDNLGCVQHQQLYSVLTVGMPTGSFLSYTANNALIRNAF